MALKSWQLSSCFFLLIVGCSLIVECTPMRFNDDKARERGSETPRQPAGITRHLALKSRSRQQVFLEMRQQLQGGDKSRASSCPVQTFWQTQPIDHFQAASTVGNYSQRYYINKQFYQAGGPLFVFIGGEATLDSTEACDGFWFDLAQQQQALMLAVEHRYYGSSLPFAVLTTANLQYLNPTQALADLVNVIDVVSHSANWMVNGGKEPIIIAFGGSYPGALAAFAREQFPSLFAGAVASSAPVQADTDFVQYQQIGKAAAAQFQPACMKLFDQASDLIDNLMSTDAGIDQLNAVFNPCVDLHTPNARGTFYYLDMPDPGGYMQYYLTWYQPSQEALNDFCAVFTNSPNQTDPLISLRWWLEQSGYYVKYNGSQCLYNFFDGAVEGNTDLNGTDPENYRTWFYQKCSSFGYFRTTTNVATGDNDDYYRALCQASFGVAIYPDTKFWNHYYSGWNNLEGNIFFVNGQLDGWHGLSILTANVPDQKTAMTPSSHCADMYGTQYDSQAGPQMAQIHSQIAAAVSQWITEAAAIQPPSNY